MSAPADSAVAAGDAIIAVEAAQGAAAVGRVIAAGAQATALVGKRVLVGAVDPCGECDVCRRGGAPVCPTARHRTMAAQITASPRWLVPLAEPGDGGLEVPGPAAAALAGAAALAYTLYARTGIGAREPAVIVGASPVARFLVEILIAKGITPVVVCDEAERPGSPSEPSAWSAWVTGRGGVAVHAAPDDVAAARVAVGSAIAGQGIGTRPWRVFVADAAATALGAALVGPRATLTLITPAPTLPGALVAHEVTVIGVAGPHPDLFVEVAAMAVKGELDLAGGTTTESGDRTRAQLVRYDASM